MAYRVIEHYDVEGLPHYDGNGTPFGAIGGHSSESAPGEQSAWDTLAWMAATGAVRGASYHEFWVWIPEAPDDFLVIRVVRPSRAAGSVGIGSSMNLDDWAKACLNRSGNANDPNQGIYAVCVIGRSKDIRDSWSKNPKFVRFCHRRLLEIREEAKSWQTLPLDRIVEHFRVNPTTRTDWGRLPINLTLEQRQASDAVRTQWHSALTDALHATRTTIPNSLPAPSVPDPEESMPLTNFTPIVNRYVTIRANAAVRDRPAFNPQNYDDYLIVVEPNNRQRVAVAWVDGTPLIASDGTVINASKRWLMSAADSARDIFYHEQDIVPDSIVPIEKIETPVPADCSVQEATIATQTQRIADLQTALGERDSTIAKKNGALDVAIAHEKPHVDVTATLTAARKA